MVVSKDAEKALDKMQHPFTRRALSKRGAEGGFLRGKGH